MRKLGLIVGGLVLLIAIMSSSAATASGSSQVAQFHGSVCFSVSGPLAYSQYGVHNTALFPGGGGGGFTGTGTITTVLCPMPLTVPTGVGNLGALSVNYYDRGGGGARVTCTAQAVDDLGNVIYSDPRTSPSGGPGQGIQTFNFSSLSFDPVQNKVFVTCTIPPINSGWPSHITGMRASWLVP